jgi:hypothetical protein
MTLSRNISHSNSLALYMPPHANRRGTPIASIYCEHQSILEKFSHSNFFHPIIDCPSVSSHIGYRYIIWYCYPTCGVVCQLVSNFRWSVPICTQHVFPQFHIQDGSLCEDVNRLPAWTETAKHLGMKCRFGHTDELRLCFSRIPRGAYHALTVHHRKLEQTIINQWN